MEDSSSLSIHTWSYEIVSKVKHIHQPYIWWVTFLPQIPRNIFSKIGHWCDFVIVSTVPANRHLRPYDLDYGCIMVIITTPKCPHFMFCHQNNLVKWNHIQNGKKISSYAMFEFNVKNAILCIYSWFQCTLSFTMYPASSINQPVMFCRLVVTNFVST